MKVYRIVRTSKVLKGVYMDTVKCFKSKYRAETLLDELKEQLNSVENIHSSIKYNIEILEVIE